MECVYNNKNSKIPKVKTPNSNVSSTKSRYQSLNPYSPENLNTDSPLMKYLRSKSPITNDSFSSPSIKHQYISTSKGSSSLVSPLSEKVMEEDVLVMDGIFVKSGRGGRVLRSGSASPSSSSSSSGTGHSAYKLEVCRAWEDFKHCRYGSKCQFAHGKEELHPTRFPIKNKCEAQMCKSYTSVGSCPYGPKCRFVHQFMPEAAATTTQMVSPTKLEQSSKSPSTSTKPEHTSKTPTSSINSEHTSKTSSSTIKPKLVSKRPGTAIEPEDSCKTPTSTITSRDWSPFDDGIEVACPSHADKLPSREEIDAHINSILYGPTRRRRLPVFAQSFAE